MRKITIDFHDQAWDTLEEMAQELPCTKSEVLRDALSLYWWLFREHQKGSVFLVKRENQVTEWVQPRLEALRERSQRPNRSA